MTRISAGAGESATTAASARQVVGALPGADGDGGGDWRGRRVRAEIVINLPAPWPAPNRRYQGTGAPLHVEVSAPNRDIEVGNGNPSAANDDERLRIKLGNPETFGECVNIDLDDCRCHS